MLRRLWVAGVGLGLLVTVGGCDTGSAPEGLPAVGDGAAIDYRLVYRVTTPEDATSEEHNVHRPFDAHVVLRDADGEITSERWSTLGSVVTRDAGGPAVELSVAAAPALGDSRLDRLGPELVTAGHATEGGRRTVGNRACTEYTQQSVVGTVPDGTDPGLEEAKPLPAVVTRCVDAQGIVLEERWRTPGGETLLTKRAVELSLDDVDLEVPDGEALTAEEGNGSFRQVDDAAAPPFAEQFSLTPADEFTRVGRFAVVPPRLRRTTAATTGAQLELYTDVWVRGADVVLLDQGAGTAGATPFDAATAWRPVTVEPFGELVLGGDTRTAEVRLPRAAGGFVRLVGTVPIDELLRLAATVRLVTP